MKDNFDYKYCTTWNYKCLSQNTSQVDFLWTTEGIFRAIKVIKKISHSNCNILTIFFLLIPSDFYLPNYFIAIFIKTYLKDLTWFQHVSNDNFYFFKVKFALQLPWFFMTRKQFPKNNFNKFSFALKNASLTHSTSTAILKCNCNYSLSVFYR